MTPPAARGESEEDRMLESMYNYCVPPMGILPEIVAASRPMLPERIASHRHEHPKIRDPVLPGRSQSAVDSGCWMRFPDAILGVGSMQ